MKKLRFIGVFTLFGFMMAGCDSVSLVSRDLKTDYLKKIPHLANRIYVTTQSVPADDMFDELLNILLSENYMTVIVDKERHYITTETKDVGHSTLQRMTFSIQEKGNDSQLTITTEWKSGAKALGFAFPVTGFSLQENWSPTRWEKNRLGIAFAGSAAIANEFKDSSVSYNVDPSGLHWYNRKKELRMELASY
jgi:hypothetical protein